MLNFQSSGDATPLYGFEITSPFFTVNKFNQIIVNENRLDRDPPNPGKFRFQIVAREKNGIAVSAPVSVTIHLNDINDNAPLLPLLLPVKLPAGEGRRELMTVQATDNDEDDLITYSLYHVSNNGNDRFKVSPITGRIDAIGKFNAGEQFSLTVQATDKGGLSNQAILEVNIIPGPNKRGPIFEQSIYDIQVSEGAILNSSIATVLVSYFYYIF